MFSPDTRSERFLTLLAELGVTDAELRRFYECDPEAALEDAICGQVVDDWTDELLHALEATGRSVALDHRIPDDSDETLATMVNRYGYSVDVSSNGGELTIVVFDAVTNDVRRVRTAADPEPFRATLESTLLEPAGLTLVDLVDGSTLVADRRVIGRLRAEYGPRIAPFERPILQSESGGLEDEIAIGKELTAEPNEDATVETADDLADALGSGGPRRHVRPGPEEPQASTAESAPDAIAGIEGSVDGETDEAVGESEDGAVGEGGEDGSGPRTSVSPTPLDEIFADLEADRSPQDDDVSLAGGEPTVTVSDRGADDILEQTRAETDFDELAAREDGADPDAILDDAEEVFAADSRADSRL